MAGGYSNFGFKCCFKKGEIQYYFRLPFFTAQFMNGDAFAGELMKIRSDIPVILCTGHSDLINKEKALALEIKDFLLKPHTIRDLANTIRRVLDK